MKKNDTYIYPAKLIYEAGEEISVVFPDLPGCATCAATDAEAMKMARDALGGHLWCMEDDGDDIPDPTPLDKIICEPNERTILIDVFMPTIRMAHENRSVNRTITLPAWMNAAALERGVNFSQVLQAALKKDFGI
jgi:Uncharacterized conserved protein